MPKAKDSSAEAVNPREAGEKKLNTENPVASTEEEEEECWDDAKEEHDIQTVDDNLKDMKVSQNNSMTRTNCDTSVINSTGNSNTHPSSCSPADSNNHSTGNSSQQKDTACRDSKDFTLHQAVFNNDVNRICELLKQKDLVKQIINKKDKHGNTPLHLACMLGRSEEIIVALLECGAAIDTRNLNRWTPFHEACSYGNREVISLLTKQLKDDVYDALNKHKLSEGLEKTKNYRLTLKWEFQSWVPFLSRVLPSDVCVINKQGKYIRIETRILDLDSLWKRSDSCFIYSDKFHKKWVVLNNKAKKFQHLETPSLYRAIEDKVDEFMSTDIVDLELKSTDIHLTRSSGWFWVDDKLEKVGKYNAAVYNIDNVFLITRKRREHLTDEDLKRNKAAYKSAIQLLKFGKKPNAKDMEEASSQDGEPEGEDIIDNEDEKDEPIQHRESLTPPPTTNVTWNQYCAAEPPGEYPILGREQKCKTTKTAFKASVAVSEEFPISKNEFMNLLSIIPLKLFRKLKEFIEMRLPDGFPIRLDFPIFPFLSARITFQDFTFIEGPVDESLFTIPEGYEEDPDMISLLSGKTRNPNHSSNNNNS